MNIQADNQKSESNETIFEHALKRISFQAFDVLLTCGVRDLSGLLRLTEDNMRQSAVPQVIIDELMEIQLRLRMQTTHSDQINIEINKDDTLDPASPSPEEQQKTYEEDGICKLNLQSGTPIPKNLIESLPPRARNFLIHEKILTCERLLEFREEDLFCIAGIFKKTVYDIKRLHDKARHRLTGHSDVPVKIPQPEKEIRINRKCYSRRNKALHCSTESNEVSVKTSQPEKTKHRGRLSYYRQVSPIPEVSEPCSLPSDWSLLSQTLPEIFKITLSIGDAAKDNDNIKINSLGIPAPGIDRLREIVLFPEDPADFLFSISMGYLIQSGIMPRLVNLAQDLDMDRFMSTQPIQTDADFMLQAA